MTAGTEQITLYAIWKAVAKEETPIEGDWFDAWVYLALAGVVLLIVVMTASIYYNKCRKAQSGAKNTKSKASSVAKAKDKKEDRE